MDESQFSLLRADGRQRVQRRVDEWFADVNVVDRVEHGGGGVMVWAGVCYGQRTTVNFVDGILNAQRVLANIQQLHTALKRSGPTFHRSQSTT